MSAPIVIFSYEFLPRNDAEAFCTARFANALAEAGHTVHVVTMSHESQVPPDTLAELIPARISITRIPLTCRTRPWLARIRYKTNEWNAVDFDACIRTLKRVLLSYEHPVLVSRSNPAASNLIAWHCRHLAARWVAHFSDPFPWFHGSSLKGRVISAAMKLWGRRIMRDADGLSVTCTNVLPYFEETYGSVYRANQRKFFVTPHIGEPLLSPVDGIGVDFSQAPIISHTGNLSESRFAREVLAECVAAAGRGAQFRFLQAGYMNAAIQEMYSGNGRFPFVKISIADPRAATTIFNRSSVNLVVDLDSGLDYVPFLPSKFVYLLFADGAIVVYSKKNSAMHQLARAYPEAGLFFADTDIRGALADTLERLLGSGAAVYDRRGICECFSKKTVSRGFLAQVEALPVAR